VKPPLTGDKDWKAYSESTSVRNVRCPDGSSQTPEEISP
jgi:hypothetical protein